MTPERLMCELERLALRLGVAVRVEPFGAGLLEGHGGLCWVHGQPLVVMDASMSLADRIVTLTEAFCAFDLTGAHMPPFVRAHIESARRKGFSDEL